VIYGRRLCREAGAGLLVTAAAHPTSPRYHFQKDDWSFR
jgi:hypothetical protein